MANIGGKLKEAFTGHPAKHVVKCIKQDENRVLCLHTIVHKNENIPPLVKSKILLEDTGNSLEPSKHGLELYGRTAEEIDAEYEFLKEHIPRHIQKSQNKPVNFGDR